MRAKLIGRFKKIVRIRDSYALIFFIHKTANKVPYSIEPFIKPKPFERKIYVTFEDEKRGEVLTTFSHCFWRLGYRQGSQQINMQKLKQLLGKRVEVEAVVVDHTHYGYHPEYYPVRILLDNREYSVWEGGCSEGY